MTRLGWVLIPVLLAGACGRGGTPSVVGEAQPRAPTEAAVYRGDLEVRILLTGELRAEDAVALAAPNVNIWPLQIRWLAEDGIEVEAGDPIAEFDNSQLTSNLDEMRVRAIEAATRLKSLRASTAAEEAQARFELEQRKGELEKARLEAEASRIKAPIEHQRKLLDLKRAELELDKAASQLAAEENANRAEIEIQRIALETAWSGVQRAEDGIEKLALKAPRSGILLFQENRQQGRPYQIGDSIYPGRTLARLPDLDTLLVEARLFDVDDGRVAPGDRAHATLDAFPELDFSGRIRSVDRIAKDVGRGSLRRFFRTLIDLEQTDPERMRPGMSVKLEIETLYRDRLLARREALDWREGEPRVRLGDGSWAAVNDLLCNAEACALDESPEEAS